MKPKTEYEDEKELTPSYFLCGAGGEVNCPHWDDINGCWCNAEEFGDNNCYPPANIEDDEEDYDEL